jgi:hypothetical protein
MVVPTIEKFELELKKEDISVLTRKKSSVGGYKAVVGLKILSKRAGVNL